MIDSQKNARKRLLEVLKEKGHSKNFLAKQMEKLPEERRVSRTLVYNVVNGDADMSDGFLRSLAAVYGRETAEWIENGLVGSGDPMGFREARALEIMRQDEEMAEAIDYLITDYLGREVLQLMRESRAVRDMLAEMVRTMRNVKTEKGPTVVEDLRKETRAAANKKKKRGKGKRSQE